MGFMTNKQKPVENLMKPIFYPLNQYHRSYVEKTKKDDINWRNLLEQLEDEYEIETSELLSPEQEF